MTSTTRLDSLAAGGTDHVFARVRLADGLTIVLKTAPGADVADEVGLLPGLFPPATEAWENEDRYEDWLTGGALGQGGGLYLDVPVQAIRDLIEQHGGEHPDQEGDVTPDYAVGDRVWLKNNNGVPIATMNNTHTSHETVVFTVTAVRNGRYELDTDNKFARRRHCGGFGETADRLMRPQVESQGSRS